MRHLCNRKPIVLHCSAGIGKFLLYLIVQFDISRPYRYICHKTLNELKLDFEMVDLIRELCDKQTQAIQNNIVSFWL